MKLYHALILLPLLTGCFAEKVGLEDPSAPGTINLKWVQ